MTKSLDPDEVRDVALSLGLNLGADELGLYTAALTARLDVQDHFMRDSVTDSKPDVLYPTREPGYRPDPEDDRYNAWLWKANIPGASEGLLANKRVSFKDHIAVCGLPMTFGVSSLEGYIPDFDSTVVTRCLQQGATIVGKNSMDGLTGGLGFGGGIGDHPRPLNPHAPDHLTGGSSSGSAIAVATNQVDVSFGGDQAGSIRIPAAWTGVVGLKATFGLISHFGIGFGMDQSVDYVGPMARSVEDVAAALQAVAGYDGLDPRQGREVPEEIDVLETLDGGLRGLRIGVLREGFSGAASNVRDLVNAAVAIFAANGADVREISVPEHLVAYCPNAAINAEGSLALYRSGYYGMFSKTYYPPSAIAAINQFWNQHGDVLPPHTKLAYLTGELMRRRYDGRGYAKAQNVRSTYVRAYDLVFEDVDVLAMPTCLTTAPRYKAPPSPLAAVEASLAVAGVNPAVRNTVPFNYTGHPALALPCGKSGKLPVSIQLVGRRFDEKTLLRLGYAYTQLVPFESFTNVESDDLTAEPAAGP